MRRTVLVAFAAVLASALSAPPAAQATLDYAVGVLGEKLFANVSGPPLAFFGVAPSTGVGPTPLALFDPGDPRSLDVGTDLIALWTIGALDASGHGTVAFPLPADPGLAGVVVHVQAVTVPGAATLVDEITNAVQLELAQPGASIKTLGSPHVARRMHAGTALGDGRMLLSGGADPASFGGGPVTFLPGAEVFDPQTGNFGVPFLIGAPRALHTATRLADGRVLLLGGVTTGSDVLASGVVIDPATRAFTPVPAMAGKRVLHSATLLGDGRVFVVGGSAAYAATHPIGHGPGGSLAMPGPLLTELYDPATNSWSSGPLLPAGLTAHQAVPLAGGRVLIAGGWRFPAVGTPHATAQAFLYDPIGNLLLPAPPLSTPVAFHAAAPTRDGNAILAGGGVPDVAAGKFHAADRSFLFDASLAVFLDKPAVPTPAGITGGIVTPGGQTVCICLRPSMPADGFGLLGDCLPTAPTTYAMLTDTVLTDLGTGSVASVGSIHVTDGSISAWSPAGAFQTSRFRPAYVVEGDGARILVSGGETGGGGPSAELWIVAY
jgi:hypothetical protein